MFGPLATLLGVLFALSGSAKIQKKPTAVAAAEKLGYTNIMTKIGAVELLGGIAAVPGNYFDFIPNIVPFLAVVGFCALMAGAIMFHVKAQDIKGAIPAAVILAIGVFALASAGPLN